MVTQSATRRKQSRKPAFRVIFDWIDSELRTITSTTFAAVRNQIDRKDIDASLKAQAHEYLNKKISAYESEYHNFLQVMQDDLQEMTLQNSTKSIEPVELMETFSISEPLPEAVETLGQNDTKLEVSEPVEPLLNSTNLQSEPLNLTHPVAAEPAQSSDVLDIEQLMLMRRTPFHVKSDPMFVRAAGIIGKLNPELPYSEIAIMRLYYTIRHIDTWRDGQNKGQKAWGYVTLKELRDWLKLAGLYTKQSLNRWIADGVEAGYWTYNKSKKWVHYRKPEVIQQMLTSALPDELLPEFMGNQGFGGREVWIDVRGKLGTFKGRILGAWLAQRERDENGVTVQNQTIADMWGVSVRTVQYWREAAKIPHIANYAETKDPALPIKRIPNTYFSPEDTREHSHTGRSRKVRKLANSDMTARGFSPDSYLDVGEAKRLRLYFRNGEKRSALEAIEYYRNKYGSPDGLSQYALRELQTVKTGLVGLHVEVCS